MHSPTFRTLSALLVVCALFSTADSRAMTVNRVNGGANVVYVDYSIPGPVIPLELLRTYNSITAVSENNGWNGAFGWGWTTFFETTMTVTPERNVLLRDGGTGNTVAFHPEKEDPKIHEQFVQNIKRAYFERNKNRKLTDAELKPLKLPESITSRLKGDPQFRLELANKFGIKGNIPRGEILVSSEYGYQTIQFRDSQWIREKDTITQYFDKDGRIIRQRDKNGFYVDFKYGSAARFRVSEIVAQDKTASLKLVWRGERIQEIIDNKGKKAKYTYDGIGNLVRAVDGRGVTYVYKYENKRFPHLITRVEYISEQVGNVLPFRELRYDDAGLVTFHHEKDGAETTYAYGKKPSDPDNNFWTKSVKKSKGGTEEVYDEFFIKARPDGSKYLYKTVNEINGASTTTVFTACCGKPLQVTKNGETTNYKYYENGLLQERVGPKEDVRVEYDLRWRKISKISQNGVVSNYDYDEKGNLIKAQNSGGKKVALKYDRFGRIAEMTDVSGRLLTFKYGDQGKPTLIAEKSVGTLRITYNPEGKIVRTETLLTRAPGRKPSQAQAQEVVKQLTSGFQQLLDIIRPAGLNLLAGA